MFLTLADLGRQPNTEHKAPGSTQAELLRTSVTGICFISDRKKRLDHEQGKSNTGDPAVRGTGAKSEDHAAWVESWLTVLENGKRSIFSAAAHAQRAADDLNRPQLQVQKEPPLRLLAPLVSVTHAVPILGTAFFSVITTA